MFPSPLLPTTYPQVRPASSSASSSPNSHISTSPPLDQLSFQQHFQSPLLPVGQVLHQQVPLLAKVGLPQGGLIINKTFSDKKRSSLLEDFRYGD